MSSLPSLPIPVAIGTPTSGRVFTWAPRGFTRLVEIHGDSCFCYVDGDLLERGESLHRLQYTRPIQHVAGNSR